MIGAGHARKDAHDIFGKLVTDDITLHTTGMSPRHSHEKVVSD